MTQRVQFLEAKGLTPAEIDIAMRQAAYSPPPSTQYAPQYGQNPYAVAPPPQTNGWDWRDYFVSDTGN